MYCITGSGEPPCWGLLRRQRRSILPVPVHTPVWCVTAFGFVLSCALSVLSTGGKKSSQRLLLRVIKFWWEWILTPPRQELPLLLNKNYKCLLAGMKSACHFGKQTVVLWGIWKHVKCCASSSLIWISGNFPIRS